MKTADAHKLAELARLVEALMQLNGWQAEMLSKAQKMVGKPSSKSVASSRGRTGRAGKTPARTVRKHPKAGK